MPTLAPWLTPPDYLAAMRSGAGIGLNLRQQDLAEQEAADRLRESYAHLSSQEGMERQRLSVEQAIAQQRLQAAAKNQQAALGLRAQQADALNRYREEEIKNAQDRLAKQSGNASIVEHPEVPGMKFLRNPSGAESPVIRPDKDLTPERRFRLQIEAQNLNKLGANELATDPSYQSRTNLAGDILRQYPVGGGSQSPNSQNEVIKLTKDGKKAVFDSTTKKFLRYAE